MKSLIKISFSRFSESYDKEAVLQKKAAEILVDFAGDLEGMGLDLGCGTGFLYRFSNWENLIGIDIAEDMIKFYKKFNNRCLLADIERLPFKDNSFDFIVSNFALHWTDIKKSFNEAFRVLKKEGYFVFNIPFKGSMEIVEEILGKETFDFLCVPEILTTLKKTGFSIEDFFAEDLYLEFLNGYSLLSHLHKTGVTINTKEKSIAEKRKIVKKFKDYKKPAILNYRLLFVKAYKS